MARALNKLTARTVATLKTPGRHSDGGGLYLSISPDGSRRRWVFMFRFEGNQKELGLGSAAEVSLAEAREKRRQARALVEQGINPIRARQEKTRAAPPSGPSFGEYAAEYVDRHSPSWRNAKHIAQWRSTLSIRKDGRSEWINGGYCEAIREKQLADITREDILAILQPHWLDKHETMSRLRGRIETILDAAAADRLRSGENPAHLAGLKHLLPQPQKIAPARHFAAMPYADVPAFIRHLRLLRGMGALALEFLILTAARSGEVRGATWGEVNMESRLWTIPAARMKAGVQHQVPLTDRAAEILQLVRQLQPVGAIADAFVFPGQNKGRPLSDMSLTAVMRRLVHGKFTVHGFRSSFRDWAGDCTPFPREICEAALAHTTGNAVERAYRRGSALEKRRELMKAWASYCGAIE